MPKDNLFQQLSYKLKPVSYYFGDTGFIEQIILYRFNSIRYNQRYIKTIP